MHTNEQRCRKGRWTSVGSLGALVVVSARLPVSWLYLGWTYLLGHERVVPVGKEEDLLSGVRRYTSLVVYALVRRLP